MCRKFFGGVFKRHTARRVAALLLAFAFAIGGIPQPLWETLGALFPDFASFVGSGDVYADPLPDLEPGEIEFLKTAEWDDPVGDAPSAKITLTARGEPVIESSDVMFLLDREAAMYTSQCINPNHFDDIPPRNLPISYFVRVNGVWRPDPIIDYVWVNFAVHSIANVRPQVLVGLKVSEYDTVYTDVNGIDYPIERYRAFYGGTWIDWGVDDWLNVERGEIARTVQSLIISSLGSGMSYYPFFNNPPTNITPTGIYYPSLGCLGPATAGIVEAANFAIELLGDTQSNNKVAMYSFGPAETFIDHHLVNEILGFTAIESDWINLKNNLSPYGSSQNEGPNRYDLALLTAKYYFIMDRDYKLIVPDDTFPDDINLY